MGHGPRGVLEMRFRIAAVLGAAALTMAGLSPAAAQTGPEVIASGLNNPRGLAFSPNGGLYVAESGTGGSGPCFAGPEGPACFGHSGSVTRIDRHGQRRVLTGLPSFGNEGTGDAAIGPSDVAFQGQGGMYVTEGLGLDLDFSRTIPELAGMGKLLRAQGTAAGCASWPTWPPSRTPTTRRATRRTSTPTRCSRPAVAGSSPTPGPTTCCW